MGLLNMKKIFNTKALVCLLMTLCMVASLCACKVTVDVDDTSSDSVTFTVDDDSKVEGADATSSEEEDAVSSDAGSSDTAQDSSSTASTGASQLPTATNPEGEEILGSGTKSDPYLELPNVTDEYMSVKTVSIPAGKSVYYGIQRVVGTILTINNANAYVVYNGTRYDAVGSKVSFEVIDAKALASDNIIFEIGNKGSAATSLEIRFTNKIGSRENPTVVTKLGTDYTVNLEEDNSTGHNYKYIAEKAGKLRFTISATADSVISITDNSTSKNVIGNYTKKSGELTDPDQGDAVVQYVEIEVTKGAEILINVGTTPNKRGKYSTNKITWNGKFA